MSFLYPFVTFLQPGILWPDLADFRPLIVSSVLGLLIGLMRRSEYPRTEALGHPAVVWLLIFFFVQVISLHRSGFGTMWAEFQYWMNYPLFTIVSIFLITDLKTLQRYVWGMITGGMVVVVYGFYALHEGIGETVSGRASSYGLYSNSNDYTFIIVQIVPFIYMYWRIEPGWFKRQLLAVSGLACVVGVLLSLSRGGILALVFEFVLIVTMGMQGRKRMLLLIPLALLSAAAIVYQFNEREEVDTRATNYTFEASKDGRRELWHAGLNMFYDSPILGQGSRRFAELGHTFGDIQHSYWGRVAHNTYVEILSGTGLLGIVSFLLMAYYTMRELKRKPQAQAPPWLDATRIATLIAYISILVRSYTASKQLDWSYYTFIAIGVATCMLLRRVPSTLAAPQRAATAPGGPRTAPPATLGEESDLGQRPAALPTELR